MSQSQESAVCDDHMQNNAKASKMHVQVSCKGDEELNLAISDNNTYRSRLLAKVDMKTNAELMHYAVSHWIV